MNDEVVAEVRALQDRMVTYVGAHQRPTIKGLRRTLPKGTLTNYALFDALNQGLIELTPARYLQLPLRGC